MSVSNTNILIFDDQFKLLVVNDSSGGFTFPKLDLGYDNKKSVFKTQFIQLVSTTIDNAVAAKAREASTAASAAPTSAAPTASTAPTASAEEVQKVKEEFSKIINRINDNQIKIDSINLLLHLTSNESKSLNVLFEFKDVLDTQNSDDVIISKEKKILPDSLVNDSFRSFLNGFGFPRPRPANPPAPAPANNNREDVVLVRRTRRLSPISFLSPLLIPSPVVNYSPNRIGNYFSSQSSESNLFPALPRSPRGTSPKSPRMGRKRGGFYEKYMKYKAKYIALKKQLS